MLKLDKDTGWLLPPVQRCSSPNHDERPTDTEISLLVIHGISLPPGCFVGDAVFDLFTNRLDHTAHAFFKPLQGVRVSSHFFIRRDGALIQFVATDKRAWHAGVSCFQGRSACNDYSIGIELEGDDHTPYCVEQYAVLTDLIRILCVAYPLITDRRIVGHSHIAPGRKTDPGSAFDWSRIGLPDPASSCFTDT